MLSIESCEPRGRKTGRLQIFLGQIVEYQVRLMISVVIRVLWGWGSKFKHKKVTAK